MGSLDPLLGFVVRKVIGFALGWAAGVAVASVIPIFPYSPIAYTATGLIGALII